MGIPLIKRSDAQRIARGAKQALLPPDSPPESPLQPDSSAIRGFLLQNIYGNGSGLMQLAYRSQSKNAFQVSIVGTNYVPNSAFKLNVVGTDVNGVASSLFTTAALAVNSSADDISFGLWTAAVTAQFAVTVSDIKVALGNPMSLPNAILLDPLQADIQKTKSGDLFSYIGSWIINFTGNLLKLYPTLTLSVFQDSSASMQGLSALVARQVVDLPGSTQLPVFDVQNRPKDYPWIAGSLCGAVWYPDLGYGIQWSDFRNQTINLPAQTTPS